MERQTPSLAVAMCIVAAVAVAVRWLAYTGFFGSDEVTYIEHAFRILDGDWTVAEYVGANRLGVNLPMALSAWVFGRNEFGAAFYSLACSVGEVLLVTWFAGRLGGPRAALWAGLLIATLPTHVHFGGRIMADAPLALTITASFVLFFEGERGHSPQLYFWAGLMAGLSFWIKPVLLFVFAVLLLIPILERRWDHRWVWMVGGLLTALVANGLLYLALTGNFWYVLDNVRERRQSGYLESGLADGTIQTNPWAYFQYLFVKIYHTGLVGPLAAGGATWLLLRGACIERAYRLVLVWAIGLVLLLSFLPVSFKPLAFIPKQSNYMLVFVAPLCVLGGLGLAALPRRLQVPGVVLVGLVGTGFALLLQASVAAFTANSLATVQYLRDHPSTPPVFLMSNAYRAVNFERLVGEADLRSRVSDISERAQTPGDRDRLAIIDAETMSWDGAAPWGPSGGPPDCWEPVDTITSRPRGAGAAMAAPLASMFPVAALEKLVRPKPATVYRIPAGC